MKTPFRSILNPPFCKGIDVKPITHRHCAQGSLPKAVASSWLHSRQTGITFRSAPIATDWMVVVGKCARFPSSREGRAIPRHAGPDTIKPIYLLRLCLQVGACARVKLHLRDVIPWAIHLEHPLSPLGAWHDRAREICLQNRNNSFNPLYVSLGQGSVLSGQKFKPHIRETILLRDPVGIAIYSLRAVYCYEEAALTVPGLCARHQRSKTTNFTTPPAMI